VVIQLIERPILADMSDRFYVNCPLTPGPIEIEGPEARHLATVMRARPGDAVCLFNGDGAEYPAVVTDVSRKTVVLDVTDCRTINRELNFRLEVASAVPKGDRGDFLVEKLTELGVTRFVPLRTRRSVVHPRVERLERTVIEASKQCGRNRLMQIAPPVDWDDHCRNQLPPALRLIAHPGGSAWPKMGGDVRIAVGPEGGFTDEEMATAEVVGWQTIGLGPRILRVETAALAVTAFVIEARR
jgi:16S rRNA (uracil1498-N3)-methyltransferase